MAYNQTYDWKRPLTDYFEKKWASQLPGYINGKYYGSTINNALTPNLNELFNPSFFAFLKGIGENDLKAKLAENSVHNWKPRAPVRLYHGDADEIVPYFTSQTTFDNFKKRGAEAELITIEDGTHASSFMPMFLSVISWLDELE